MQTIDGLKKVCVLGAGMIGSQIALNTAIYGYEVDNYDQSAETREKVKAWADEYLKGRVQKGRLTLEQSQQARARYRVSDTMEGACQNAQFIIESVYEDINVKKEVFTQLNKIVAPDIILGTNSGLMVSSTFKDCIDNPSRLANIHYFSPALHMKAVEVVQGEHTSDETAEYMMEFLRRTGKTPIRLNKEIHGFIVNHLFTTLKDDAAWLVQQGICSPEDIDIGCEQGLGHAMGPFRSIDFTGLDLSFAATARRYEMTGVKPPLYDLLKVKVEAGELGRKSGKGFYDYTK